MSSDSQPTEPASDPVLDLLNEGRLEEAQEFVAAALMEARQKAEDEGRPGVDLVAALEQLATLERETGNVEGAEAALKEALETAEACGADTGWLASLRTSLATLLDFSQREADAAPLYEQAIMDYESLQPPAEEVSAQLRNNLAMIYKGLGKFSLAEQHYLKALETLEKNAGADPEAVAALYNNLGGLYYTAGFAEQAKDMFTQSLNARLELLDGTHPDVAQSYSNLATVCHELGDNEAAEDHFEESLRILELHLPEEAGSYEEVAEDYLSLLDLLGDERKVAALRKRIQRVLAA